MSISHTCRLDVCSQTESREMARAIWERREYSKGGEENLATVNGAEDLKYPGGGKQGQESCMGALKCLTGTCE